MKSLIKNYIDLLDIKTMNEFGIKNDIHLNERELSFLLDFVKKNYEDIIKDETPYLDELEKNINKNDFIKIKELFLSYKKKFKGYLF